MASQAPAPVPKNILLFGATGVIGGPIITQLVASKSSFEKIGIFTSPGTLERKGGEIDVLKKKGVEVIVGDVESEDDVKRAYEGYDTIISALGRPVLLSQLPLLRLASASPQIHTFCPSEYGTDIAYAPSSLHEKPHQLKLQVRRYILEELPKASLNVTYLVTGPYSDLYLGKANGGGDGVSERAGSWDVQGRKAVLLGDGKGRVSFTTMADVGRLLVASLKTPTSESERILKVNSFTATPHDILSEFEGQTGGKWEVKYTSLEELREVEGQAWEAERRDAAMFTLRRIWTEGGTLYAERDNGKVGDPKTETLEDQVREAIRVQTQ